MLLIIFKTSHSTQCTGNTFIDEDVLAAEGITDLSKYSVVPGAQLYKRSVRVIFPVKERLKRIFV